MKYRTIYRVEHAIERKGPYHGPLVYSVYMAHSKSVNHPGPSSCLIVGLTFKKYISEYGEARVLFGFKSMEQLHRWFSKENIQSLKDAGYVIRKYKSPIVTFTDKQAVFVRVKKLKEMKENRLTKTLKAI